MVTRRPVKNFGECGGTKERPIIYVDGRQPVEIQIDTVIHEHAHCDHWCDPPGHTKRWALAYWKRYQHWNDRKGYLEA